MSGEQRLQIEGSGCLCREDVPSKRYVFNGHALYTSDEHNRCRDLAEAIHQDNSIRNSPESTSHTLLQVQEIAFAHFQYLRTCRQVYLDACPIMCSTNAFMFETNEDFKLFMARLTVGQTKVLKELHLTIDFDDLADSEYYRRTTVLPMSMIRSLSSLANLHLQLTDSYMDFLPDKEERVQNELRTFECVTNFKVLPLKDVTIRIKQRDSNRNYEEGYLRECEENIKHAILDPEGPQRWQEQQEVHERAKQAAHEAQATHRRNHCCRSASTEEECAEQSRKRQENLDRYHKRTKPTPVPVCGYSHVCLICNKVSTSRKTLTPVEGTRPCSRPGRCKGRAPED